MTAYIDDILIFSEDESRYHKQVKEVLKRLRKAYLTIDLQKCDFKTTETLYLGLIVSTEGIKVD